MSNKDEKDGNTGRLRDVFECQRLSKMTCSRQNERLRLFAGLNVRKSRLTVSGSENMERIWEKKEEGEKISAQSSSKVRPPSYHDNRNGVSPQWVGWAQQPDYPRMSLWQPRQLVSAKPLIVMVTD